MNLKRWLRKISKDGREKKKEYLIKIFGSAAYLGKNLLLLK